jgi:type II secretory pathway component GspD/PulD (secretin)
MKTMLKVFAGLFLITFGVAAGAEQPSPVGSAAGLKQAVNPAPEARPSQIQVNTYVVEVSTNDDLFGAAHWPSTLGHNSAAFALSGNVGAPPNTQEAFFKTGVILKARPVIRALTDRGKSRSIQSPVTHTISGERVIIRSVQYHTIFLETAAAAPATTPYTFATGLTLDVIPRILGSGIIDLTISPAYSTQVNSSSAPPGTNTTVPIVSIRSATAEVEVRSGEAAVIGGITQETDNYIRNGVPGLQNIPLFRYLFQTPQKANGHTNLVIVVWPRIVNETRQVSSPDFL